MRRIWKRTLVIVVIAGGVLAWLWAPGRSAADGGGEQQSAPSDPLPTSGLSFPYILDSGLIVEEISSYSGVFYEDGTDEQVTDVAALLLFNPQQHMVRFGAVALEQNGQQLYFFVYCLPPGGRCLILEKQRTPYQDAAVTECRALNIRWEPHDLQSERVRYVGFGEALTVVNHSAQRRNITVWYKHYDYEKDYYIGGVAYSAYYFMLGAEEERTLMPSHYHAGTAKVVAVE